MSAYSIATRGLAGRKIPQGVLAPMNELLFGASEQGAWYDPSDLSTLFQDTAGTTPVTAVEQFVALMLDKSGRGNHASQATSAKRLRYSRRVNLFTESEFRNGVTDAPARSGLLSATTLSGYLGAIAFGYDGVTHDWAYKSFVSSTSVTYVLSVVVKMDDGNAPAFVGEPSGGLNTFALVVASAPKATSAYIVTSLGDGLYRVTVSGVGNGANSNFGVVKYLGNNSRTFKVTAYDVRLAIDAHLPYQRVNTATDYDADPAKFPAYLCFDGVDDALQTGNIDFTGTDKMTVWAGVTKLSDAAVAVVTELGTSLPVGGFYVAAPNSVGPTFGFASKGTIPASPSPSGHAAPISRVVTGVGDIGADIATCRVNGVSTTLNSDQGTGNYGNYPLYIGARAGTSLFFNGRIYNLIVRGAATPLPQIEAVETLIRQKMRLP